MQVATRDSIEAEIRKLECLKEVLLAEDDPIWDEVNATDRDLNYLKQKARCLPMRVAPNKTFH